MIRRPPHRDQWTDALESIDVPTYRGPERRNAFPSDRRGDIYIEQVPVQPISEKKPFNMPFVWQILTTIISAAVVGVGLYLSNHDDQLRFRYDMTAFQDRYKEDQNRHNLTHDKIFKSLEETQTHVQSLEETLTQSLVRRK